MAVMLIPFILARALSLYQDKEAVVSGEERFTYGQFAERTWRLGNLLAGEGVGEGECVAILHQNSHEFLEAYFATAYLGAILNLLNTRLSPKELAFILKDSGAKWLIASKRFGELVKDVQSAGVQVKKVLWTGKGESPHGSDSIDYEQALEQSQKAPLLQPDLSDETIAHLYYTSGTTGLPKGAMLSHKNVCTHALA
ncbi:MAG: AMP-binding protein, partial [Deltaproteobacteria bacterium]|nr:AMP-binding protein [Deltaproteobacteria bacterium]MBW2139067.1 AMP-binding protein [Deltaproteobacteria bacterium]